MRSANPVSTTRATRYTPRIVVATPGGAHGEPSFGRAVIATSGKPRRKNIPARTPCTGDCQRLPRYVAVSASEAATQQMPPPIAAASSISSESRPLLIHATRIAAGARTTASRAHEATRPIQDEPVCDALHACRSTCLIPARLHPRHLQQMPHPDNHAHHHTHQSPIVRA
jgi:hypothetical protein